MSEPSVNEFKEDLKALNDKINALLYDFKNKYECNDFNIKSKSLSLRTGHESEFSSIKISPIFE